jgi:hypothetical protein
MMTAMSSGVASGRFVARGLGGSLVMARMAAMVFLPSKGRSLAIIS